MRTTRTDDRRAARLGILALSLALVTSACSVSTPRNGFSGFAGQPVGTGSSSPVGGGPTTTPVGPSTVSGPAPGAPVVPSAPGTTPGRRAPRQGGPDLEVDNSSRVGVTDTSITISVVAGYSGPFAQVNEEILRGLEIWRDEVNSRGGINDRRIAFLKVDHKDTSDGGVAACKEVQNNGSFFAIVPAGVPGLLSSVDCLDRAGFPVLYHEAPRFLSRGWTHAYGGLWTPYDQTAASLASFVKNVEKDGDEKLGVIHINTTYFKRIADSYVKEAKALGMRVVAVQPVEENQSSFVSEMQRMQEAGIGNIVLVVALEAVGIFRDARAIGYAPTFTAMILTLDFLTKAARDLATGVRGLRPYATVDTRAFQDFRAVAERHGYTIGEFAGEQFYSYGAGLAMGEVLRGATMDPSRAKLFASLDSIKGFNNRIQAPITWGPGNYAGTKASFPVVCCDANWNWKRLGPPARTF